VDVTFVSVPRKSLILAAGTIYYVIRHWLIDMKLPKCGWLWLVCCSLAAGKLVGGHGKLNQPLFMTQNDRQLR
jgi:hypothetical protein